MHSSYSHTFWHIKKKRNGKCEGKTKRENGAATGC